MLLQVDVTVTKDDGIESYDTRQRPHIIKDLIKMLQQYSMTL